MGFSIAEEFAGMGASVILVAGPVSLSPVHPGISIIRVTTAAEMLSACEKHFDSVNIAVFSAAVADFSPRTTYTDKVKRGAEDLRIALKPTVDIAAAFGKKKRNDQIAVGFALETFNEMQNAQSKLRKKNLDLIVLNSLNDPGAGFQTDTNKITIIDKNNNIDKFELKSKAAVAVDIVEKIIRFGNL
jgi:phosphopantothenoylcysteine decarboxylase/phosphopantothenate--cysteine ligase